MRLDVEPAVGEGSSCVLQKGLVVQRQEGVIVAGVHLGSEKLNKNNMQDG